MNMKMKHILGGVALAALVSACASTGTKSSHLKGVAYTSLRMDRSLNASDCPASEKSWRKQSEKTVNSLAASCVKAKKWSIVEAMGEHLAAQEPGSPWGAYYLSLAAEGQGKLPRAQWMAELAVKKAPDVGFLYYQKGRVLWALGDYGASVDAMKEAVGHDDHLVDAHLFLGQLYYRDQDSKRAMSHFQAVLRDEPANAAALIGAGDALYLAKDYDEAIPYFEKAVSEQPQNINLRLRLAEMYEAEKQYEKALSTYKRVEHLAREKRVPASELGLNVQEHIGFLESEIAKALPGKKVSKQENASEVRK